MSLNRPGLLVAGTGITATLASSKTKGERVMVMPFAGGATIYSIKQNQSAQAQPDA